MTQLLRKDVASLRQPRFSAGVVALWLVAAVFVAGHAYLNIFSLRSYSFTDFHVYHEALGRAARGETVYDLTSPMPFLYPPFFLIVLWPMGWLSEPTAMTVWLHLQNAFLVLALAALIATFRPIRSSLVAWAIILSTGFSPVMLNNLYGQANLLYLAILSVFILAYSQASGTAILPLKRDRLATYPTERGHGQDAHATIWEIVAALALSAAINIRILPVALLAMAIIQRRYRMAIWTAGFVMVEAMAAGLLVGFSTEWNYFASHILHLQGLENMREISLLALFQRMIPSPQIATLLFTAVLAVALASFFILVWRPMRDLAPSLPLHLACVTASMALFSPLLEYHHYTLLLAPYVLVLGDLAQRNRLVLTRALPVFLSWAIVSGASQLSHYQFGAIGFAALAGAALIWAYTVWLIVEGKPSESRS